MVISDNLKYHLDQIVYHKLKPDIAGMVTGITYRSNGIWYWITWSNDLVERSHSEAELTDEKGYKHVD